MATWLGAMRLAEKAGLIQVLARALKPVLRRLFPDVPAEHPAMGSMVMNIAANMLGLSNAATPLGLRAMKDLESLNQAPGTATNAMCTFLAINTSSVQLVSITAVAVLAAARSVNPTAIIGTAFLATLCAAAAAITSVKLFERLPVFRLAPPDKAVASQRATDRRETEPAGEANQLAAPGLPPIPGWGKAVLLLFVSCFVAFFLILTFPNRFHPPLRLATGAITAVTNNAAVPANVARAASPEADATAKAGPVVRAVRAISLLAIPFLLGFFPLYAALRRIHVYNEFVEGAKEGFNVALRIIPFLVAMLVAIGMFRGAGGIDLLTAVLRPALDLAGFPAELLPMALIRPLSGSASLGIFSEMVSHYGPDHTLSRMAGTLYGSTETTFYVLAVYFGSVSVTRTRHAVPAGLIADATGIIASVMICRLVFE
jgi:spore maturation protein SpmA